LQNGAATLQVSVALQNSSQWMSTDLATNNYFSHTDTLQRSPGTRLIAFGYTYYPWGENLAAGYSDALSTLNQWINACDPDSSLVCTYAHRNNMLNPSFKVIGIGRAYNSGSSYGWYWTTDFGGVVDQVLNPSNPAPTISSFTASPGAINLGQTTTLSWNIAGAVSVSIDNGVGDVSGVTSRAVSPSQTTTYTLTATNVGGASTARITVSVNAIFDSQPPTAPVIVSATAVSSREIDLTWSPSADNVGISGYQITRNGSLLNTVLGSVTTYADMTVQASTTYTYSVKSFDAAGNYSPNSNSTQVITPAAPAGRIISSKVGMLRPGAFMMVGQDVNGNIAWDPGIDRAAFFGTTGDTIIYGDWDGSGSTKVGIFRSSVGMFALDMNGNGAWDPGIDTFGFFGQAGDVPIVGDWNGDGRTKVGIYRPTTGLFAMDYNGNLAYDPGTDKAHQFGLVGDTPVIGDWTGDGKAKIGVFRSGLWILDSNNNLTLDAGDTQGTIGQAGDTPLLGDWNGDRRTKVGIYRSSVGMFAEDYNGNLVWDNGVDRAGVFGAAGSTPVVGDWTGTGVTRVGVFYGNGYWGLDINGNLVWDAGVKWGGFGSGTGDTPVVGKWQ
jgi:Cysteine-rich secretory protein family